MRLYAELAPWFHLLTSPVDYRIEADRYRRLILGACPDASTLLELGSGGGNNASHLKRDFTCTLSDLSPQMLSLSTALNPECEHVLGDMRSMRLGRTFDAVFVHDAVVYMTSAQDLRDAIATAFAHTRPGGVALFAPDCTRETYPGDGVHTGGHDGDDGRALRYLEWTYDTDPDDGVYEADFAVVLREPGRPAQALHDHHVLGLFPEHVWLTLLEGAGFRSTVDPGGDPDGETPQPVFVARRPPAV
ncbi:MAG TPA: class I SAM-dependent methyltransferase [Gaiellaceae bacterium]|nr:class I SAM-dependent methyltransferase [Gaiellaceae bacterium]